MNQFGDIFRGKRVLVTGHTGFKGSWLTLWLHELGANVIGLALPPATQTNHWDLLKLPIEELRLDIRDIVKLTNAIRSMQPEIVFHLAAQPLVRRSYRDPLETWSTNVMGTANVLEACRHTSSVRAIVAITTDKCYENQEWHWGYRENDRLGGHDPYSTSKACSELIAASYRRSFFDTDEAPLLATARAGNVIGGGDWSEDRLIPDLIRSISVGESLEVRSPNATRPWQHVLESLAGYLMLGERLLMRERTFADAWNFGPGPDGNRPVSEILGRLTQHWNSMRWHVTQELQPHETTLLYIDNSKARNVLLWEPVWNIDTTLIRTAEWYQAWFERGDVISRQQLSDYATAWSRTKGGK